MPSVGSRPWSARELQLRKWVLDNPGTCKQIAVKCKVSAEYVRLVLYGKRGGKGNSKGLGGKATSTKMEQIKRMLKGSGAPV